MTNFFKKRGLILICLVILLTCCVSSALAATPEFAMTRNFINVLESNDYKYTFVGKDSDGDEHVKVTFSDDILPDYTFHFYFDGEDFVNIRIFDVVTVSAGKSYTLNVVNTLNRKYNIATFTFDEEVSSIDVECDLYVTSDGAGSCVYKTMRSINNIFNKEECTDLLMSLN